MAALPAQIGNREAKVNEGMAGKERGASDKAYLIYLTDRAI